MSDGNTGELYSDREDLEALRAMEKEAAGVGGPVMAAKPRLQVVDRKQTLLKSVDVEKLVEADHPVRAIWEFVGNLDLAGFTKDIKAVEGVAGRTALDPHLLISLWVYAYSKGVNSAREVSRLCEYDPAYQWLTGLNEINHHSLSDFRVEYREALDDLFTQILGLLSAEGLITMKRVMHDGTKVKANAGADTFRREKTIRAHLEMARRQVEELADPEAEDMTQRVAKARQRAVQERAKKLEQALKELEKVRASKSGAEAKEEARVSETDPEARVMKQSDGGYAPSYNVQISADAANTVIVGVSVSQSPADYGELVPAVDTIKENMDRVPDQMVVDGGFVSRENIVAMADKKVDLIGPLPDRSAHIESHMDRMGVDPAFRPHAFHYSPETDLFTCPNGKSLTRERTESEPGVTIYTYRADRGDCRACPFKEKCCPKSTSKGRKLVRTVNDPVVEKFVEKMQTDEAKGVYKQRGQVAEFPNAWIKAKIGLRQFSVRGKVKVWMESVWACLTYNIMQWVRLKWLPRLTEATA